jgi:uncharacterized repeat protein (TIGR03803 family)
MKKLLTLIVLLPFSFLISPYTCIAQNQTELWGMTTYGSNGGGMIFKTDNKCDNQELKHSFIENQGRYPNSDLCLASNGKLYGMTSEGGGWNYGILFEYDPATSTYTKKLEFEGETNGRNPYGSLMQASNGKLYGMTYSGGINNYGVLFEYDPITSIFTKKLDFDETTSGREPYGSLIQASNGKLYGMTYRGGTNGYGVLFEYDPTTSTYTKKLDFNLDNGATPWGSLIQTSNGKLFGMTSEGGVNFWGVLFEYDPATSTYTKKLDFDSDNGGFPVGSLMQASNGKLYGMTSEGGVNFLGVLFEYDPATSTYTKKLEFEGETNGRNPCGSLMQASNGKLYGMTSQGGANDLGVLFEYDPPTSTYTKKLDFDEATSGMLPYGSLIQASSGKLYGMTHNGGKNYFGVLFEYDPATSTYTKKLEFESKINGINPYGSLMQASNWKLYGMTHDGGANDDGVFFEYDPATSTYTKKLEFEGETNGRNPYGSLMQASNGKLYGMTYSGGANNGGVLFEYDPANSTYTKKLDFETQISGSYPYGSLIQASNGKLYGTNSSYGTIEAKGLSYGVLFEYDPATSTYTKKLEFEGETNGRNPCGSLMQASNGKLYGMTSQGGANDLGVLFEYDPPTSTYTKKLDFGGIIGREPYGSLMQASDGKLYGMTSWGGEGFGNIFEFDITDNTYENILSFFDFENGQNPSGSLMQASNGKMYGMTRSGGAYGYGILFEFDYSSGELIKKLDFDETIFLPDSDPRLIEICVQPAISNNPNDVTICSSLPTSFSIAATGNGLSFQWEVDEGAGFTDITNNSIYTNVTTNTLNITNASYIMNGYKFRCKATSTCPVISIFSNTATLTVDPLPASPGTISGITIVCQGQNSETYTVPPITDAISCIWTLPTGATGTSTTNSITVSYGTSAVSGDITVRGNNICGDGPSSTLPIVVNAKPATPTITQNGNILHSDAITGNQWFNQTGLINGATNQDYTVISDGNYYVIITINGCSSEPSNSINVVLTEIEVTENNRTIKVYPNPVVYELIIEIEGGIDKTAFEILNSNGQKVFTGWLFVQTADFSPGIYFIKIENGKTFEFKKIVK